MFSGAKFKYILLILVILCLGTRLIYVHSQRQLPVMWDARIYSASALGLIHYLTTSERFGHPELDTPVDSASSQARFINTMDKYLDGGEIAWLHYPVPTVARAEHYLFLSGPVLPAYLAAIFVTDFGNDFALVRIVNSILDCLCLLLLMLKTVRLIGKRAAILAGVLYILYLPFILMVGMVSPEQITVLLILLTLYMVLLWYDNRKSSYMYIAGLALGLLVLTKPTAILLVAPFIAGFIYDNRDNLKKIISPLFRALIPFILVTIPWFIITSMYFDRPAIRDPEYSTSNLRSSSSIVHEGYDLDYVNPDFWLASLSETILDNPPGYGNLLLKKFSRLWAQPYNDMDLSFVINQTISRIIHFVIVLSALFGVFFVFIKRKKGMVFLLLIPLYYTIIHIIFHALARYNLNAMPIIIIASAMVIIKIYDYVHPKFESSIPAISIVRIVLIILGGGFILFFPSWPLISLIGAGSAVAVLLLIKTSIFMAMSYYLFKSLSNNIGRKQAIKFSGFPVLLLMLMIIILGSAADGWSEWKCHLKSQNQAAGVRIYFSPGFRIQPGELCRVVIDMTANHDRKAPFLFTTNGETAPFYFDRFPVSDFYYHKTTYDVFELIYSMDMQEMRNWRSIPLNEQIINQLLDRYGYLDFKVQTGNRTPNDYSFIDMFGYYPSTPSEYAYVPSFSYHATSIERFVEKGDPRIWTKYQLSSDSVISYYIDDDNQKQRLNDLSPAAGRQYGRFGIFLEVMKANKAKYHY